MRLVFSLLVIMLLSVPSALLAQTKEIISEGTYNMGDGETPSVAESRALIKAKQIALEQAGTYVESYSKVKNITLTQDEIHVLASGLMEVEILDKKRTVVGDGINFWVKIKAKVNPDKMEEMAKRVKEKSVVEDYKRIQEAYEKSQKEIEKLMQQLAEAKDEKRKKNVEANIADSERLFQAYVWSYKGHQYYLNKELDNAIEAYTSAIALNEKDSMAYSGRGVAYREKGLNDKAIDDITKAIRLNPNIAINYISRGIAYDNKGQYDNAIEDYNKAVNMDPNLAWAYNERGLAYAGKGQYDKAIEDYNKAIAFNPNDIIAYCNRGVAYRKKGQYDRAIEDYNKAIAIDPKDAVAYTNRGIAYDYLGSTDKAIGDFRTGCDLGDQKGCKAFRRAETENNFRKK